jgi:hypothetical protein
MSTRNDDGFEWLGVRNESDGGFQRRWWLVWQRFELERFHERRNEKEYRVSSQRLTQTDAFAYITIHLLRAVITAIHE